MSTKLLKTLEHTCLGSFDSASRLADGPKTPQTVLRRPAMMVYMGDFDSMDGPVSVTEDLIDRLVTNHNALLARLPKDQNGRIEARFLPPLQLDHSTSARDTVGRVTGELYKGHYTDPETGAVLPAAFTKEITVLGADNAERVDDGRWANLSIGADLDRGILSELTITPFPAAARASILLSRQNPNKTSKGAVMNFLSRLKALFKLSADTEGTAKNEKLRTHVMDTEKCSAEVADEKLSKLSDEEIQKMASDVDEKEKRLAAEKEENEKKLKAEEEEKKRLAAEEDEKKKAQLSAKRDGFIKMAKGVRTQLSGIRLESRKASITARLSGLRAAAKLTPAEQKQINVSELAAKSDEAITAALSTFEKREPVVHLGVRGTTAAEGIAKLSTDYRSAKMELESRLNMPSKRADAEKRLQAVDEDFKSKLKAAGMDPDKDFKRLSDASTQIHIDTTPHAHYDMARAAYELFEKGQQGEGLGHLRKLVDALASGGQQDDAAATQTQMSALAENVKRLQDQQQELIQMVGPILGVEEKDLAE